jgi:hypothetical protein
VPRLISLSFAMTVFSLALLCLGVSIFSHTLAYTDAKAVDVSITRGARPARNALHVAFSAQKVRAKYIQSDEKRWKRGDVSLVNEVRLLPMSSSLVH